ncbi:uncharacterized protein [Periplaneta americana]|uniref:uncharacterized protein n=1 Tax=Periplaneta americana TaxID=6978 RepID=UPI0037E90B38
MKGNDGIILSKTHKRIKKDMTEELSDSDKRTSQSLSGSQSVGEFEPLLNYKDEIGSENKTIRESQEKDSYSKETTKGNSDKTQNSSEYRNSEPKIPHSMSDKNELPSFSDDVKVRMMTDEQTPSTSVKSGIESMMSVSNNARSSSSEDQYRKSRHDKDVMRNSSRLQYGLSEDQRNSDYNTVKYSILSEGEETDNQKTFNADKTTTSEGRSAMIRTSDSSENGYTKDLGNEMASVSQRNYILNNNEEAPKLHVGNHVEEFKNSQPHEHLEKSSVDGSENPNSNVDRQDFERAGVIRLVNSFSPYFRPDSRIPDVNNPPGEPPMEPRYLVIDNELHNPLFQGSELVKPSQTMCDVHCPKSDTQAFTHPLYFSHSPSFSLGHEYITMVPKPLFQASEIIKPPPHMCTLHCPESDTYILPDPFLGSIYPLHPPSSNVPLPQEMLPHIHLPPLYFPNIPTDSPYGNIGHDDSNHDHSASDFPASSCNNSKHFSEEQPHSSIKEPLHHMEYSVTTPQKHVHTSYILKPPGQLPTAPVYQIKPIPLPYPLTVQYPVPNIPHAVKHSELNLQKSTYF